MPELAERLIALLIFVPFAACAASQRTSDWIAARLHITQRPESSDPNHPWWGRFSTVREWSYWIVLAMGGLYMLGVAF